VAEISFTGFVVEWSKANPQNPDWGMRVSEPHRKKDGDQWVTVGRTVRTVKAAYGVQVNFGSFKVGDRVIVVGKEVTETSEKDGKRYDNLVVKAETIEIAKGMRDATHFAAPESPAEILADFGATPF